MAMRIIIQFFFTGGVLDLATCSNGTGDGFSNGVFCNVHIYQTTFAADSTLSINGGALQILESNISRGATVYTRTKSAMISGGLIEDIKGSFFADSFWVSRNIHVFDFFL